MKVAAILALAATLASTASASYNFVTVANKCRFPIWIESDPNDGSAGSGAVRLNARNGLYEEEYHLPKGSAVKLAKSKAGLGAPLTFGYTPDHGTVYYDLSNNAGNPFSGVRVKAEPADKSCPAFDCGPGRKNCYSNAGSPKTKTCHNTNFRIVLCPSN